MTIRELLHGMVDQLPEGDPIEELQYRLYVLLKVRKGLTSIDEGRGLEHRQVVERMNQWLRE